MTGASLAGMADRCLYVESTLVGAESVLAGETTTDDFRSATRQPRGDTLASYGEVVDASILAGDVGDGEAELGGDSCSYTSLMSVHAVVLCCRGAVSS